MGKKSERAIRVNGKHLVVACATVSLIALWWFTRTALAAEYVQMTIEPKDAGVFYQNKTQQFQAYGWTSTGQKVRITDQVDWYIDPDENPYPGQNTKVGGVATIDDNGLATVQDSWGRVVVKACFPKGCAPTTVVVGDLPIGATVLLRPSYVVTSSASGNGAISPEGEASVKSSNRLVYDLTPEDNSYEVTMDQIGGTCPKGELMNDYTQYKTGPITEDCSVVLPFTSKPVIMTEVDVDYNNGSIVPQDTLLPIYTGATQIFSLEPVSADFQASELSDPAAIAGDCPAGTLIYDPATNRSTYETGAISTDCTLTVRFTRKPEYTITTGVDQVDSFGAITPGSATVNEWDTQTFTLIADDGYIPSSISGTCPKGDPPQFDAQIQEFVYTTGRIMDDCSVIAHFTDNSATVNSSVNGIHGSVAPLGDSFHILGEKARFDLTPDNGYVGSIVSDSCGDGGDFTDNSNSRYETAALTGDCAVVFEFVPEKKQLTVQVNGNGGVYSVASLLTGIPDLNILCGPLAEENLGEEVCVFDYDPGQDVSLKAFIEDGGSVIWSGCTASGDDCSLTMDSDKTVTASFN